MPGLTIDSVDRETRTRLRIDTDDRETDVLRGWPATGQEEADPAERDCDGYSTPKVRRSTMPYCGSM
jgi:hypothetical protein